MKTQTKKEKANKPVAVRGSGYTYTEDEKPTDKSTSLTDAKLSEVVILPKLGKKL
jgi:hypothetical protein